MDSSGEDASEHYPEICGRTELGSHYGSKDRTGPGDIQELDHEYFPSGHRDKIHTVRL